MCCVPLFWFDIETMIHYNQERYLSEYRVYLKLQIHNCNTLGVPYPRSTPPELMQLNYVFLFCLGIDMFRGVNNPQERYRLQSDRLCTAYNNIHKEVRIPWHDAYIEHTGNTSPTKRHAKILCNYFFFVCTCPETLHSVIQLCKSTQCMLYLYRYKMLAFFLKYTPRKVTYPMRAH